MSVFQDVAGADVSAVAISAAVDYDRFCINPALQVFGTFVGTYDVELSIDGTNFSKYLTGKTAPEFFNIPAGRKARINCTARTSGTIEWRVGGAASYDN